ERDRRKRSRAGEDDSCGPVREIALEKCHEHAAEITGGIRAEMRTRTGQEGEVAACCEHRERQGQPRYSPDHSWPRPPQADPSDGHSRKRGPDRVEEADPDGHPTHGIKRLVSRTSSPVAAVLPLEADRAAFTRMDRSTRDDWMKIARATVELQP